jgi:putative nucleotidyltransferase with HDIG domain
MDHISQTQIRPTEYMLEKTTILVVDDEPGPRESLKMILSPAHRVVTSDCGPRALEILRTTPVDLVTIDLNMPGMKGEELMRTVRKDHPATEIIVITGNGSVETAVEGLRFGICDYISKPFDVVEVSGAVSRALERKQSRSQLIDFLEGVGTVLGKDRDGRRALDELETNPGLREQLQGSVKRAAAHSTPHGGKDEKKRKTATRWANATPRGSEKAEAPDTTLAFLDVLAHALESRDSGLRRHAQRVGFYADLVAERLGTEEDLREHIRICSFLHDIGKVGLSDEDRQRAQLRSRADSAREEDHPEIGARLVGPLGFDERVADAIRHHHEHWDGGGFPDSLAGEAIPIAARFIAVVDSFDKLTEQSADRAALSAEEALAQIAKGSGSRFDPAIVAALSGLVESGAIALESAPAEAAEATR